MTGSHPDPLHEEHLRTALVDPGLWATVTVLDSVASTNKWCADHATTLQHRSVVTAEHQVHGRGRLDRTWDTPQPGVALTTSVLLQPAAPRSTWGWLTLMAGVAVAQTLQRHDLDAWVKWPNDVLIGKPGAKVCGVLAEAMTTPAAVVVGFGINVHQDHTTLPVGATSVAMATGAVELAPRRTELLAGVLQRLAELYQAWERADGDAHRSGVLDTLRAQCRTIGADVDVTLPGVAEPLRYRAVDIDRTGCLIVTDGTTPRTIASGDVVHVRPAHTPRTPQGDR